MWLPYTGENLAMMLGRKGGKKALTEAMKEKFKGLIYLHRLTNKTGQDMTYITNKQQKKQNKKKQNKYKGTAAGSFYQK